jgi:hypothetical protein
MNLRQLRYVVATADHGTMTAAAQALFVAQPALSRAIRDLERELGVELFARAGRGVALTDTGEQIVRYARDALRAVDAITAVSSAPSGGRPGGRTGELRVASTLTLEPELTARLLPEFARDQQAVRVRVLRCDGRDAVGAVVRLHQGGKVMTRQVQPTGGYLSQSSKTVHFGLGDSPEFDRVEVTWPSGLKQQLDAVKPNALNEVVEPGGKK